MFPFRSVLLVVVLVPALLVAQVPIKCLEIESILVDACNPSDLCPGSSEGQNEMVRFRTGPDPIALDDIEADWPNNSWRGLVQNTLTAQLTAQLNATVASCGFLIEPVNGIIPPGSQVLMVTSTEMCVAANPFTNLVDTLFLVFQQEGNTQGHFANNPAVGDPVTTEPPTGTNLRSLVLFHTSSNCSDTATYVRELLVNNEGTYAGVSAQNDGATTRFSWPGVPVVDYVNFGCQAPIEPLVVEAQALGLLCGGAPVDLVGSVEGEVISVQWQGGLGIFSDPNALNTTYTPAVGESGSVELQLCVTTSCAVPLCTTLVIPAGSGPTISVDPTGPLLLCGNVPLTVTASGADSYAWSTGANTAVAQITAPGTLVVTGTNACGSDSLVITVITGELPSVSITGDASFCAGSTTTITAQGPGPFTWNTGASGPMLTVANAGTYSVTTSNGCGSASAQVDVVQLPSPQVSISGPVQLCTGASVSLTANGASDYLWSTGSNAPSITVTSAGTYSVVGTNACGTDAADVTVTALPEPVVSITGNTTFCSGGSTVLTATGNGPVIWNNGATAPSITVTASGTYTVSNTNGCGTATDQVTVQQTNVVAVIEASAVTGFAPFIVVFSAAGEPLGNIGWDLGDGTQASSGTVTHTFTEPGSYPVDLSLEVNGCSGSDQLIITVLAPGQVPDAEVSSIIVPNVITPNGDGMNDRLEPLLQRIVRMELRIYNRWGQEVAYLDRPGRTWDARGPSGEPVVEGTYFYAVEAWGGDGVDHSRTGSITILR